jgi:hypothetical protein
MIYLKRSVLKLVINFFVPWPSRNLMDDRSNCEWSVIYVGVFISLLATGVLCTSCYFSCKKRKRLIMAMAAAAASGRGTKSAATSNGGLRSRRGTKYSKLNTEEPDMELRSKK